MPVLTIRVPAGLLCLGYLLSACGDYCRNSEVNRLRQPSGSLDAVVFLRNCGATTDLAVQVSIVPKARSRITGSGNAFAAVDTTSSLSVPGGATAKVSLDITVQWAGESEIQIGYDKRLHVTHESMVSGILVTLIPR